MKRSRIDTLCTILTISINGIKKTHIMYRANLSHIQLEKFLNVLISKDLLIRTIDGDGSSYKTTSKGLEFIKEFEKIQILLGENNNKIKIPQRIYQ